MNATAFKRELKAIKNSFNVKKKYQMATRFYNINSLFGNDWALFYLLFGAGDTGKSYAVMKWCLQNKMKKKDNLRLYWTRLSDVQCKKLLCDNASHLIDADLYRKFKLKTKTKDQFVYYGHDEITVSQKTGKETSRFIRDGELMQVVPLATFFNNKGQALFDNQYNGEYVIVLDEAVRDDNGERNYFNIVEAFTNQLENFCRDSKVRIRVICIGNNCGDSEICANFNFVPKETGRYYLRKRRCIIDYINPSKEYAKDRAESVAGIFNPNSKRFASEPLVDNTLVCTKHEKRTRKPSYILKFSEKTDEWFTVSDKNIVSRYGGEKCKSVYGMRRYIPQTKYFPDIVSQMVQMYDLRAFRYTDYAVQILLKAQFNKLKQ